MDPDKLREELIREQREAGSDLPHEIEATDDLDRHIRIQAKKIAARFTEATDTGERKRLEDRYKLLDRWLGELDGIELLPPGDREPRRQLLRATVLEEFRRWGLGGSRRVSDEQQVELGRKHLVERSKPGGLTHAHKRIKDEIEYLLKNYRPANEAKIETLIDKWRRSGDPSYDPSVKLRLRNARRKKSSSDNPF